MNCPQCNSIHTVKNGNVKQQQRYLCKNCRYQFTLQERKNLLPKNNGLKRNALHLLLEGVPLRKAARLLQIPSSTLSNWKKNWGQSILLLQKSYCPDMFDYKDSMSYWASRKNSPGYTMLWIDLETDVSLLCQIS